MELEAIKQELLQVEASGASASISGLAERMEDALIGVAEVPDDFVDIVLYVIGSPELRRAKGAAQFVLNAYLDHDKFSQQNASRVLKCIGENFDRFDSEEMCLVSVDYVVRKFESTQAAEMLMGLGRSSGSSQRMAVRVGADALLKRRDLDAGSRRRILKLCERLQ